MHRGKKLVIDELSWSVHNSGQRRLVLANLHLNIAYDDWIYLDGPNGCGKTTLLSLISGRLVGTTGTAQLPGVGNFSLVKLPRHYRASLVTQEPVDGIVPGLSILEHFWIRRWGSSRTVKGPSSSSFFAEVTEFLADAAFLTPLLKRLKEPADTLSGGWKHLLQISSCLFGCPDLLLLDEALTSLAKDVRDAVELWLLQERGDQGLIVTDHRGPGAEILERLDKKWFLSEGSIEVTTYD